MVRYTLSHGQYTSVDYAAIQRMAASVHLIKMEEDPVCEGVAADAKRLGGSFTNIRVARLHHPHLLTR